MDRKNIRSFYVIGGILLVLPVLVFAQATELGEVAGAAGLPTTSLPIIIARIIRAFLGVLGIIMVVLILYGGFVYMTAGGEAAKVEKAKAILKNAAIGAIIIFSAFGITQFILSRLLGGGADGGIVSRTAPFTEPLSGSLGIGIIQDHFPSRNALDMPRNVKIFVTFKEPVDPASIINEDGNLKIASVKIFQSADEDEVALTVEQVNVFKTDDNRIFTFDPIPLLGDGINDVNYTVQLTENIEKQDGSSAFARGGYEWTFEVGTEVDLTPPKVISVVPANASTQDRNITVSITFNEAMDPIASTGFFDTTQGKFFNNIITTFENNNGQLETVQGEYTISNGYKTVDFTTSDLCGQDPCGDPIFCLPGDKEIRVQAKAADIGDDAPQASSPVNGLTDAVGNSLDGNGDGIAEGPDIDSYLWDFSTTNEIDDTVPSIHSTNPGLDQGFVDPDQDVEIIFSIPMKSSTLVNDNIQLLPDPWYEFWFVPQSTNLSNLDGTAATANDEVVGTKASIKHPTMVPDPAGGYNYYPVITNGVKGANQICMYPAFGPSEIGDCAGAPYCCNGIASDQKCSTKSGENLPYILE